MRVWYAAAVVFLFGSFAQAQSVAIRLQPLINGLTLPDYVTNAHDGSNRLFILEQGGIISVMQPGSSSRTTFLDISSRVLSGGEQGLLGLAFHPQFAVNGRFFVDYTRKPDGATVIAEYRNGGGTAERVLLVIPQPYENHNGGMVEFGPDGLLYVGMGDGGSGNDPQNRAQNPSELLGKILRIDADSGQVEIYSLGMRNPFRFSFDRPTGLLYAGDVGQDEREEIDIITRGGNYGWRVFEGYRCTGLGPASCSSPVFIPPIAEYDHSINGRCSIIGGYVYRGSRQVFPDGAYIYGDYCSGEIFMLQAGIQTVLLKTNRLITSFGQDESGELYVVGQGGTVDQITGARVTPVSSRGFNLSDLAGSAAVSAGEVDLNTGYARIQAPGVSLPAAMAILGFRQNGVLQSETFLPAAPLIYRGRIYADVDAPNVNTAIAIGNPGSQNVTLTVNFTDANGNNFGGGTTVLAANHQMAAFLTDAPYSLGKNTFQGTFSFIASSPVSAFAIVMGSNSSAVSIPVMNLDAPPAGVQIIPHFAYGPKWSTSFELVNPTDATITGSMHSFDSGGQFIADIPYAIAPRTSVRVTPSPGAALRTGSLRITPATGSAAPSALALVSYNDTDQAGRAFGTVTGTPGIATGTAFRMFVDTVGVLGAPGSVQQAIAIANPSGNPVSISLQLYNSDGSATALSGSISIPGNGQTAVFVSQVPGFASLPAGFRGVLRAASDSPIAVTALEARYNELDHFLMASTLAVSEDYAPASQELLLPQIAIGNTYEMRTILFDARAGTSTAGTINFFDPSGNPLALQFQ